jgi:EpsI family protein
VRLPVRVALTAGLLVAGLLVLHLRGTGEAVPIRQPLDRFPAAVGEWQGREATILDVDILNVLRVKDYLMRRYADPAGRSVLLYIGYWDSQKKGAAPHSPRNCLPGSGWEPLEASELVVPLAAPHPPITVNRYVIQKERAVQVVLYWYQAQGQAVAGEVAARIAMVKNSIVRNRTDGALVRVSSPVYGSIPETTERLTRYAQALYPILGQYLPD